MRRWLCVFILCIACLGLCLQASALTQINSQSSFATVSADGSCQVTVTATIHLDQPTDGLVFPVPRDAASISLNGSWVRIQTQSEAKLVPLSGKVAGDISFTVSYTLPNLVSTNEAGLLELRLPLLSGFAHPISFLEFSVTMPGPTNTQPAFSSGYHQATIEEDLSFVVDGAMISGRSQKALKDHETLVMILPVSEEMFPQAVSLAPNLEVTNIAAIVCAVLTVLFWLLFLRTLPPRIPEQSIPPEGYSAGQLPCLLFLQGADLSMMIFTWAQLGYLHIRHAQHGRVQLYKQMDMGNERSSFERRCFSWLFAKRSVVDTSSQFYAQLCQKVAESPAALQGLPKRKPVFLRIFRILACLISVFCGVGLATVLADGAALLWLLVILLGVLGGISGWMIQQWLPALFCYRKRSLYRALILCAVWLGLGALAQQFQLVLWMVLSQLLASLLSSFGASRTLSGRQAMAQAFGLWRYLFTSSRAKLLQMTHNNPEYFYDLAPYALALGVDRRFAKRIGKEKLPECPYLFTGRDISMDAVQWNNFFRQTVQSMNARQAQLPMERIKKIIRGFLP